MIPVSIIVTIFIAEFSLYWLFYFSIYNPLKKKEDKLVSNDYLTRIKRYLLRNSIKQTKSLLDGFLILFFISVIALFFKVFPKISFIFDNLLIMFAILYLMLVAILVFSYISFDRRKEAISEAKNVKDILKILKLKKKYQNAFEKIISLLYKEEKGSNKFLLAWFLDIIEMRDKRILS